MVYSEHDPVSDPTRAGRKRVGVGSSRLRELDLSDNHLGSKAVAKAFGIGVRREKWME